MLSSNTHHRTTFGVLALLSAVIIFTPLSSHAFDGHRKGFIIGGGLGIAPYVHILSPIGNRIVDKAVGVNLLVGYGFGKADIVAYGISDYFYRSEYLDNSPIIQGLDGPRWYHYWSKSSGSLFSTIGVGRMVFGSKFSNVGGRGLGAEIGFGYEFTPHIQIASYMILGRTKKNNLTTNHLVAGIVVTALAY